MRSMVLNSAMLTAALVTSVTGAAQAPDYANMRAQARQALGGDSRLSAIRTFRAKGAIEDGSGQDRTFGSFEVACELPDKFVETDTRRIVGTPGGADVDTGTTMSSAVQTTGSVSNYPASKIGFNRADVIYEPSYSYSQVYPNGYFWVPLPATDAQLAKVADTARNDFARWTMALFAESFGASQPFVDLQFDPLTHLPTRLDNLQYLDYRDLDGLKVPFRLRQLKGPAQTDWIVRSFTYNVTLDPKIFQPTKHGG